MKYFINSRFVMPLVFVLIAQTHVHAAPSRSLVIAPNSSLWLVGDSTLHPFTCRTTQLNVSTSLDPQATSAALSSKALLDSVLHQNVLKQLRVSIPVQSLKSHESSLDKNMYKALKAKEYPTIDFELTQYDVMASSSSAATLIVRASGTLRIAGHEQPIVMNGTITTDSNTSHVEGTYTLLMTDYGIKPPTMMMGTIKVKNPVVIHFDLLLSIEEKTTS